jgi:hypothetical protein
VPCFNVCAFTLTPHNVGCHQHTVRITWFRVSCCVSRVSCVATAVSCLHVLLSASAWRSHKDCLVVFGFLHCLLDNKTQRFDAMLNGGTEFILLSGRDMDNNSNVRQHNRLESYLRAVNFQNANTRTGRARAGLWEKRMMTRVAHGPCVIAVVPLSLTLACAAMAMLTA